MLTGRNSEIEIAKRDLLAVRQGRDALVSEDVAIA
jgi:hypothetical protein